MKQIKLIIIAAIIALLGAGYIYTQQKESNEKKETTKSTAKKDVYVCPMHLDVKSDKPGKCTKCGMNLVKQESSSEENESSDKTLSAEEKVDKANELLEQAEDELVEKGKYNCCLSDPCHSCLMEHKSCGCYASLKKGGEVCNECYGGWQRGDGADKNIKKESVKTKYEKHMHKH